MSKFVYAVLFIYLFWGYVICYHSKPLFWINQKLLIKDLLNENNQYDLVTYQVYFSPFSSMETWALS